MKILVKNWLKISGGINLLLVVLLSGCSGAGGNSTSGNTTCAPIGPNSYPALQTLFNRPHILKGNNQITAAQSSSTNACGISDSDVEAGLAVTSGFISMVPIAGPALGAMTKGAYSVLSIEGSSAENSCIQSEFNLINQQLAIQEAQIQNIESALNLTNNTFYQSTYQNAAQIVAADQLTFQNSISNFSGQVNNASELGALTNLMIDIKFWSSTSQAIALPGNLAQYMESNPSWLGGTYIPGVTRSGNQADYQSNLVSLAGVNLSSSCINAGNQPYTCVSQNAGSSQIAMYQALYSALTESIPNQQYNNYIPLYDNYNDTLMQAYQQTIVALQQAYFMEYLNNQVNYNNAIECIGKDSLCLQQTLSYGNVAGTYFVVGYNPVNASNESASYLGSYNDAQQQLTLLFAAYMNQAYINTLNYIVTDSVVGAQVYPTGTDTFIVNSQAVIDKTPVNYAADLSSKVVAPMTYLINNIQTSSAAGAQGYSSTLATSLQHLQSNSSIMLYQYYGLNNTRVWAQSVFSSNSSNSGESLGVIAANYESAPQLFINGSGDFIQFDQAIVPGYLATPTGYPQGLNYQIINQSLMPYYAAPSAYPVASGSVDNNINLSACNPSAVGSIPGYSLYWYVPNGESGTFSLGAKGTPYLMCGNWQTSFYQLDVSGSINNDMVSYSGSVVNFGYLAAHSLTYANLAGNAWTIVSFSNNPQNTASPMTYMASPNANNFGVGTSFYDGGTLVAGNQYASISAGGFGNATSYNYVTVAAAFQATFPDGFIASFGINPIQNSNDYDTNTIGISYNPNLDIVQINGESINIENARWNYPSNPDGDPYKWAAAILNVTLTSINPTGNNSYMSGLIINGNLLFVNGSPINPFTFNGYTYPGQNTYLSLNPESYTSGMPAPYGITVPNCQWPWENYKNFYELPTFVCTLSSYW